MQNPRTHSLASLALAAALTVTGQAALADPVKDTIETLAFLNSECALVFEDLDTYRTGTTGLTGEMSEAVSKDTRVLSVNKTVGDRYIEIVAYRFEDRELIDCAAILEHGGEVDHKAVFDGLVQHLQANPDFTMVGGYAPLYTDGYVIGLLGLWPEDDLATQIALNASEAQFEVSKTIRPE